MRCSSKNQFDLVFEISNTDELGSQRRLLGASLDAYLVTELSGDDTLGPPAISGSVSTFSSLDYRFGADGHLNALRLGQQPKIRRRPIAHWHGAPSWEGPFN